MSEGLKLLRKIIDEGDRSQLFQVNEDDFLDGEIANEIAVYNYILEHSSEHNTLPTVETIRTETGVRLPEAGDSLSYYLDKIIQRKTYNLAREINSDFRSDMASKDVSNLYSIGRRFMDISNDDRLTNHSMYDGGGLLRSIESAKLGMREGDESIPTGFPSIDSCMMGGLRSSDFAFIIARTHLGKSQIQLQMAKHAYSHGNRVLIVSMEMGMDDMSLMFAAHMADINPKYVNPYLLGHYDDHRLRALAETIRDEDRIYIHKGGTDMTPNKVRWLIESLQPDIVYIDSMYLMQPDGNTSRMDRFTKVAAVTDQMLSTVVECGVPIVCTSQFNRQAGKGGVDGSLENIGFSDTISTHASLILTIKTSYIGDEKDKNVDKDKREIEIIKSRKGPIDPFDIDYTFSPMCFSEIGAVSIENEEENQDMLDALNEEDNE